MAELERSEKIVWFLAPTVDLATQQFNVIQAQIPGVQSKLIYGADNVDAWSSKPGVWDAVLLNTRVVVSTYQILFDAVTHALVPLKSLSLIVVDEAHNCVGNNAVARLMREHFAVAKANRLPVPHILGLTASPLMRSELAGLELLEQTLDAVCKTPSKHRAELIAHVNRPSMITESYGSLSDPEGPTATMASLNTVYNELDIKPDPYILRLLADNRPRARDALVKAIRTKDTYCQQKLRSFCAKARNICKHLGPWAADYYVHRVITEFLKAPITRQVQSNGLTQEEVRYLAEAFLKVDAPPPPPIPTALSAKVLVLIKILESQPGNPVGIVFVEERATVAVLSHILSVHPRTVSRYRVGSVVGSSRFPGRSQDFLDLTTKEYLFSLQAFRKGTTNLLVATSALEEGIDVPACNLVVCFDRPKNLKSFIQRRGRARMSASQLYLLVEEESGDLLAYWQGLEQEMKRKYEDDMREIERLEEIESSEALYDYPVLRDEETGAQITIHDAKQHLEHFCATLSTRKFVDWSPFYVVRDLEGNPVDTRMPTLRKATVHLPVSLAPELRQFESLRAWPSEANACRDAAFQAYAKLYEAGLVNRHLLPIRETDLLKEAEPRTGIATVREQFNPWPLVAQAWRDNAPTYRRRLTISSRDKAARAELELVLPVQVPYMEQFALHWDHESSWLVSMEQDMQSSQVAEPFNDQDDHTSALLAMAFGHRWRILEKHYPVRFVCLDRNISIEDMGVREIRPELMGEVSSTHLVRDSANKNHPYFYLDWLPTKPSADLVGRTYLGFDEAPEDAPYVAVRNWPKKAGLFRPLHPNAIPVPSSKPYPRVLPADQVRVDNVPSIYAHVGMLVPAITQALEAHLMAQDLLQSRLENTGIRDLSLVVTAISTSASRGPTDYERTEFLGDSILKFCTTVACSAKYLKYPEGCLSPLKDKIVANSALFRAAVDFGLDRYIIHKAFTLHKWRPTYVEDLLDSPPSATETRRLSTKILADVVEALIGASYISGGIRTALTCISLFLPKAIEWQIVERGREILYDEAPSDEPLPVTMRQLESLVGYTFTRKSLLVEAMTHPSCSGPGIRASLDRLEFLGDAILDHIVVGKLFSLSDNSAPLDNSALHLLRTALVNADILAFLVMEWSVKQERVDVDVAGDAAAADLRLVRSEVSLPLWSFMRHASPDMGVVQRATALRHAAMRQGILDALWTGDSYPWSLLCRLQAQKFYSDVLESLLGAVWVDSGSLAACEAVVERVGILPLMRRLVRDGVRLLHPKEELGQLAVSEKVEYEVEMKEEEGGDREFACRVLVGGLCVGKAEGAFSKEEARTRAAEEGCRFLKERMREGESRRGRG
ncbi:hypothetical protein VTK56DRAFT_7034 [Thermocarpiscus australiensis]